MNFKKSLTSIIFSNIIVGASLIAGCASQQHQTQLSPFRIQTNTARSQQPSETVSNEQSSDWGELRKVFDKINEVRDESEDNRREVWNSPKKTIKLGYGDCEDKASLGAFYAESLGYSPKVLILFDEEAQFDEKTHKVVHKVHAVTLLEEKNNYETKYGVFDIKFPIYPSHNSIDSLVEEINKYHIGAEKFTHSNTLDLNSISNWRITDENLIRSIDFIELNPLSNSKSNQIIRLERKGNLLYFNNFLYTKKSLCDFLWFINYKVIY